MYLKVILFYFYISISILHFIISDITRSKEDFEYDQWDNLVSGTYSGATELKTIYKTPDAVEDRTLRNSPVDYFSDGASGRARENESAKQDDRVYDVGGKLLSAKHHYYYYDSNGNLLYKEYKKADLLGTLDKYYVREHLKAKPKGSGIGYMYKWSVSGQLTSMVSPGGLETHYYYDPLGRRIAKTHKGITTRWVWDGNVPLHEWQHQHAYPRPMQINDTGKLCKVTEPKDNITTWLYEVNSFVPCGKIKDGESFSIVSNYLGTPEYMYSAEG